MNINHSTKTLSRERGLTMVELLVALAISLVLVLAATYVYLATRQSDRALERSSDAQETGTYVLQLLGREIGNAGYYPAARMPIVGDRNIPGSGEKTQIGMIDTYPPLQADPRRPTDWMNTASSWPPVAFMTGIFGCDDALFDPATSTCSSTGTGDTIVINSFTSDIASNVVGTRRDCTGAAVDNDPNGATAERKNNTGGTPPLVPNTAVNANLPPQSPLFVSNRYAMRSVKIALDSSDITSFSLACSGNGKSPHGQADATAYQPIVSGLAGLKFSYGVYSGNSLAPDRFYSATEVGALTSVSVNGQLLNGWQRITAVRVCVLTQTLGGGTRLSDKTGEVRTYRDCSDAEQNQPTGSTITRYTQVFGLRNALKQTF